MQTGSSRSREFSGADAGQKRAQFVSCLLGGLLTAVGAAGQVITPPACAPQCTTFTQEFYPRGEDQGVKAIRVASGLNGGTWAIAEEAFDTYGNKKLLEWTGADFAARPGGAVRVAIDDRKIAWVVTAQGNIFRRNLGSATGWDLMPGLARHIAAGRPGIDGSGLVWAVGMTEVGEGNYELYKWNGRNGWTRAPGAGVKVAVDGAGTVWVQLADGRIVQQTADNQQVWLQEAHGVDLFVHPDGSVLFLGLPAEGTQYRVRKRTSKGWSVLAYFVEPDANQRPVFKGFTFESASFDPSGAIFTIASDHRLFGPYRNTSKAQNVGDWLDVQWETQVISRKTVKLPGYMSKVFLGANGQAYALGRGTYQMVYRFVNGEWELMGNSARSMAIAPNGTPWVVNENDTVYRFENNRWTQVGFNAREIAIGDDGSVFFLGVGAATDVGDTRNYQIFKWNGNTAQKFPGGAVKIAVQSDGIPWVVSANSQLWRWNSGAWVNVPGSAREIYGGKTILILGTSMDGVANLLPSTGRQNGESQILELHRRLGNGGSQRVEFPDTNPDKTGYLFNATGSFAMSLASVGDNLRWTVRADHSVFATFEATKGDESNYRALTERCKSTLLFQTLCAAVPYHIHPALPLLLRVEDYARAAATSSQPEAIRVAAFAGLMQIADKGSDAWLPEEKAVLSWMVHRVKEDRVLSTLESLREYYKWKADPESYKTPAGYGFEPYQPERSIGLPSLFVPQSSPPMLHRQDAQEWLRDVVLQSVVASGYGNLLGYASNSPNGVAFPAYGQALAFKKVIGGDASIGFSRHVLEAGDVRGYLYAAEPALVAFLLDQSATLRSAGVTVVSDYIPHEIQAIKDRLKAADPGAKVSELLAKDPTYLKLVKHFVSTSAAATMLVTIALDVLLDRILELVGEGKLEEQLEDASAQAQSRPVPDIHHLLGYALRTNTRIVLPPYNNKPLSQLTPEELDYVTGKNELFLSFLNATVGCESAGSCTSGVLTITTP